MTDGRNAERGFMGCGCFSSKGQYQKDPDAIRAELTNIEQLTADMLDQLRVLDTSAAAKNAVGLETDRWFMGRLTYCTEQCRGANNGDKDLAYLQCLKWAAACHLETLLARYDSLTTDSLRY